MPRVSRAGLYMKSRVLFIRRSETSNDIVEVTPYVAAVPPYGGVGYTRHPFVIDATYVYFCRCRAIFPRKAHESARSNLTLSSDPGSFSTVVKSRVFVFLFSSLNATCVWNLPLDVNLRRNFCFLPEMSSSFLYLHLNCYISLGLLELALAAEADGTRNIPRNM